MQIGFLDWAAGGGEIPSLAAADQLPSREGVVGNMVVVHISRDWVSWVFSLLSNAVEVAGLWESLISASYEF